jgi:hypothetical protein
MADGRGSGGSGGPRPGDRMNLADVAARLWDLLAPYRDRLEESTVYGMPILKRPGAGAHGFFAGIRIGEHNVGFHLKPLYDHPELLGAIPASLRKRMSGKQAFTFTSLDDQLAVELAALLERAFELHRRDLESTRQSAAERAERGRRP